MFVPPKVKQHRYVSIQFIGIRCITRPCGGWGVPDDLKLYFFFFICTPGYDDLYGLDKALQTLNLGTYPHQ